MRFGSKFAAGFGVIAALGLVAPAFAATTPNTMGSGAPMQPGTTQPGPSNSDQAMRSSGGSSMRSNSGVSAQSNTGTSATGTSSMSGSASMNTAQGDASNMSKDQVMAVQQALNLKADGVWGPQTEAALKKYQQQSGLPATGQLDQATRQKLNLPS